MRLLVGHNLEQWGAILVGHGLTGQLSSIVIATTGLTENPTYLLTAETGVPLTFTPSQAVDSQGVQVNAGSGWTDIAGAGATYTPTIGSDGVVDLAQVRAFAVLDGVRYFGTAYRVRKAEPVWDPLPFFVDPEPTVGDTVVLNEGSVSGETIVFEELLIGTTDVTNDLSGLSWDSSGQSAGTLTAEFSVTTSWGTVTQQITAELVEPSAFHPSQLIQPGDIAVLPALDDFSNMWQDPIGTIPAAIGERVARIDNSDGSFFLTNPTADARPFLQLVDGFHCLVSDGSNDALLRSPLQSTETLTEFTIASVSQTVGTIGSQTRPFGLSEVDGTGTSSSFQPASDGTLRYDGSSTAGSLSVDFSVPTVRISTRNGARVKDWIDGALNIDEDVVGLDPTHFNPTTMYFIGAATSGETRVWANFMIDRELTDQERADLQTWMVANSPSTLAPAVTQPGQVTGVVPTPGDGSASFTWPAPADGGSPITDYVVQRATVSGGPYTTQPDAVSSATGFSQTGLTNGIDYFYVVAAVNAEGTGLFSTETSVRPAASTAPPTAMATSLSKTTRRAYTRTVEFFEPGTTTPKQVECGYDKAGRAVIYSTTAFKMQCTELSSQDAGNYWINGGMRNPDFSSVSEQGFTGRMGIPGGDVGAPIDYNDVLNINKAGIEIAAGEEGCFVFAVSNPSPSSANGNTVLEYIDFTVMAAVPPAEFYRAPVIYPDKTPIFYASDKSLACFANLAPPASDAVLAENLDHPHLLPELAGAVNNGEIRNRMTPGSDVYSRDWVVNRINPVFYLHYNNADPVEADEWSDEMIIHAIDLYGAVAQTAWKGSSGAGQSWGRFYQYVGAYMLNSQDMFDKALFHVSQDLLGGNQLYFVDEDRTLTADEKRMAWPNNNGSRPQEFFLEHVGKLHLEGDGEGSALYNRYAGLLGSAYVETGLVLQLLSGGPVATNLGQYLLEQNGNTTADKTNPDYRFHAGMDLAFSHRNNGPRAISAKARQHWLAWQGSRHYPAFTDQPPTQPAVEDESYSGSGKYVRVASSATGFTYTTTEFLEQLSLSPAGLTQVDFRYSIDGRQFVEELNVPINSGAISLPSKAVTFVSCRFTDAAGSSLWSVTKPDIPTGDPVKSTPSPLVAKTETVANAAPAFHTNPVILTRNVHDEWLGNWYFPATDLTDVIKVYAGAGYPTGSPAPVWPDDYTVTFILDGVAQPPLASAADPYILPASSSVKTIEFDSTVTTAQGTVTQRSNVLNIPAAAPLPAGTLVDFTGRGRDARDQAAFINGFTGSFSEAPVFDPLIRVVDGAVNQLGIITCEHKGPAASPRQFLNIPETLVAGTAYTITFQFQPFGGGTTEARTWLEDQNGGEDLTPIVTHTDLSGTITVTINYTPGSNTDVRVVVWMITGGSAGGNFKLLSFNAVGV